jgi:hypothetical protein
MKIKELKITVIWEDGTTCDAAPLLPDRLIEDLEEFMDTLEDESGDCENE